MPVAHDVSVIVFVTVFVSMLDDDSGVFVSCFERDFFSPCETSSSATVTRPTLHGGSVEDENERLTTVTQQVLPIVRRFAIGRTQSNDKVYAIDCEAQHFYQT